MFIAFLKGMLFFIIGNFFVYIKLFTFFNNLLPNSPCGCDLAKSCEVKPRHSKSVMASASAKQRAVNTLEVGVRFKGQASFLTPESKTILDVLPKVDFFEPVIDMIGILRSLIKGRMSIISLVSPELEKKRTL